MLYSATSEKLNKSLLSSERLQHTRLDRLRAFLRMRTLVLFGPSTASCTQSRVSTTPGPGPNTALSLISSASTCSHLELTCSHSLACNCNTEEEGRDDADV